MKPPHIHTIKQGKGDNKLVITVAPQKLICPQGNTYPIKAIAINIIKIIIPENQLFEYELLWLFI